MLPKERGTHNQTISKSGQNSGSRQVLDGTIRLQHSELLECDVVTQICRAHFSVFGKLSVVFGIVGATELLQSFCQHCSNDIVFFGEPDRTLSSYL